MKVLLFEIYTLVQIDDFYHHLEFPVSEHVVSIISSMLHNCQGSQRQRLLAKFTENDYEKVDRLLELHFKYMDKVDRTEKEMEVS